MPLSAIRKRAGRNRSRKQSRKLAQSAASRVFSLVELATQILASLPFEDAVKWENVNPFKSLVQSNSFRQKLHGVPSTNKAACSKFGCRDENIAQFIRDHRSLSDIHRFEHHQTRLHTFFGEVLASRNTCIHGWEGEAYVDRTIEAYQDTNMDTEHIVNNTACSNPCFLDRDSLIFGNLNPEPLKRLANTLLTLAWTAYEKGHYQKPMHPDHFKLTCDGELVIRTMRWVHFDLPSTRMPSKFAEPPPQITFEATINSVFEMFSSNTKGRIYAFAIGTEHKYTKQSVVLCPEKIRKEFQVARSGPWTLEQMLWIVDRIPEVHVSACPDD